VKKIILLLFSVILLSGCATYKFQHGVEPYEKGYVVSRSGETIPDYTIGKNNSVPADLALAKKRFKERRDKVEYYYKEMGLIESPAQVLLQPPILMVKLLTGLLRLPFVAYTNYKYEHDPAYKAEVDKLDLEKETKQRQRIKALKAELNTYIQQELEKEPSFVVQPQEEAQASKKVTVSAVSPQEPPAAPENASPEQAIEPAKEEVLDTQEPPAEEKTEPEKPSEYSLLQKPPEELAVDIEAVPDLPKPPIQAEVSSASEEKTPVADGIKAVISAKPAKGFSPLKVKFNAGQSSSKYGRIISYNWDFGDGDTSEKPAPVNVYWSASYGTRAFTVKLTVKDIKGNTATQTAVIEVMNK